MTLIIPSVTMNGFCRRPATSEPFTQPTAAPARIAMNAAVSGVLPVFSDFATNTLHIATDEPTLRSIPPLTRMRIIPSAPTATMAVCVRFFFHAPPVMNEFSPVNASSGCARIFANASVNATPSCCCWKSRTSFHASSAQKSPTTSASARTGLSREKIRRSAFIEKSESGSFEAGNHETMKARSWLHGFLLHPCLFHLRIVVSCEIHIVPIAASISVCSVHSAAGRTAASFPRHITPMVSQTPSSSGM